MSESAWTYCSPSKHLCSCGRRATYRSAAAHGYRRRHRARADHPLCNQCWRALRDRYRPSPAATRWLPDELLSLLARAAQPATLLAGLPRAA